LRNAPLLKTLDLFRFGLVCLCAAILLSCSAGCSVSNSNSSAATVAPAQASTVLTGKVVGIVDGDTIDVLDSNRNTHRVRLAGIDAPEARQAFGARSTQNLTALVRESAVRVEWYKLDDWQRLVGKVLKNDQDICLEQVREQDSHGISNVTKTSRAKRTVGFMTLLKKRLGQRKKVYGKIWYRSSRGCIAIGSANTHKLRSLYLMFLTPTQRR
jgi:hypothetical protein